MTKYYIDACIWRDYFEDRNDRFRPLGEWALRLINKIIKDEGIFVFSDHLTNELLKEYSFGELKRKLEFIPKNLILEIKYAYDRAREANKIKKVLGVPFGDAMHVVLARDTNAILITRDNHFIKLDNYCEIRKPEDLL